MDGRGGCCIARYGGVGYEASKVDMIMLRFRPIAPKPSEGSVSGGSTPENSEVNVRCRRRKRRYAKDVKRCSNKKKRAAEEKRGSGVTTLSLLPENPDPGEVRSSSSSATWPGSECFSGKTGRENNKVAGMEGSMPVGSCVTVDCLTDTWVEGEGLGCTDEEKWMNMGRDTCPGFISDGFGRVVWTNGAYRSMVGEANNNSNSEVWLVVKEKASMTVSAVFTCRVRVQHSFGSLTLPCDVWRLERGGFAWRMDVKAALSLGR